MNIYYVQKKERMDSNGVQHINFNVTLPLEAISGMKLDSKDRKQRAVTVKYDKAAERIVIEKVFKK